MNFLARLMTTAALAALAGCGTVENLVGDDTAAHTSKLFPETRLMRVRDHCSADGTLAAGDADQNLPLNADFRRPLDLPYYPVPCAATAQGESIAVVVNGILAPAESRMLSSDIAVVMDFDLAVGDSQPQPVVVWFQKGYPARFLGALDRYAAKPGTAQLRAVLGEVGRTPKAEFDAPSDGLQASLDIIARGTGCLVAKPGDATAISPGWQRPRRPRPGTCHKSPAHRPGEGGSTRAGLARAGAPCATVPRRGK